MEIIIRVSQNVKEMSNNSNKIFMSPAWSPFLWPSFLLLNDNLKFQHLQSSPVQSTFMDSTQVQFKAKKEKKGDVYIFEVIAQYYICFYLFCVSKKEKMQKRWVKRRFLPSKPN